MILLIPIILFKSLGNTLKLYKQAESIWHPDGDFLNHLKYDETQISGRTKSSTNMWYNRKENQSICNYLIQWPR